MKKTRTYNICPNANLRWVNLEGAKLNKKWYDYIKNQDVLNFETIIWVGE